MSKFVFAKYAVSAVVLPAFVFVALPGMWLHRRIPEVRRFQAGQRASVLA